MRQILLAKAYEDEQMCVQFIIENKWGSPPKCEQCGSKLYVYYKGETRYTTSDRVHCAKCNKAWAARQGTIFTLSTLPLLDWFKAIDLVYRSNGGITVKNMQRILGLNTKLTAQNMKQKILLALAIEEYKPKNK
jgi:transposase-like protein